MANVFFTSDLHLGHEFVARTRRFDTAAQHDTTLAAVWRFHVNPDDHVWILGDLAASNPTYALGVLAGLPGIKHLVLGNHDRAHPMHRDAYRQQRQYLDVFASVQSAARRRIQGREVLLSHFPYDRDRDELRFGQWRLRDEGVALLHGHTHGTERLTQSARSTPEIHVGLDAWDMAPVPLATIEALLAERPVVL